MEEIGYRNKMRREKKDEKEYKNILANSSFVGSCGCNVEWKKRYL